MTGVQTCALPISITTTSNAEVWNASKPPTINGKVIGVGNVSNPSVKRVKLSKTTETVPDKSAKFFRNMGDNGPITFDNNDFEFDGCNISEVIMFLQKLARSPNISALNMSFTKHITNALMQVREEKLKHEASIPRKLEDGWEPIIKMKVILIVMLYVILVLVSLLCLRNSMLSFVE